MKNSERELELIEELLNEQSKLTTFIKLIHQIELLEKIKNDKTATLNNAILEIKYPKNKELRGSCFVITPEVLHLVLKTLKTKLEASTLAAEKFIQTLEADGAINNPEIVKEALKVAKKRIFNSAVDDLTDAADKATGG